MLPKSGTHFNELSQDVRCYLKNVPLKELKEILCLANPGSPAYFEISQMIEMESANGR